MIPKSLKSGITLPLFKGEGAKANNKDNYREKTLSLLFVKFTK